MSYTLEAYLVDAKKLDSLTEGEPMVRAKKEFSKEEAGSEQEYQKLMAEIENAPEDYMASCVDGILKDIYLFESTAQFANQFDQRFAEEIKAGSPIMKEALEALIRGKALEATQWEPIYAYALQVLCETYGKPQINTGYINISSVEYLVDLEVFSSKALNFRVYDDLFGMPPLLPVPLVEYPMIGYLSQAKAPQLVKGFNQLNLEHPDFGEGLATLQQWVEGMIVQKQDLITFFH